MIPSHAHDVEFEGDSKRYTSFIQISSTLPQFSLPLGDDLSDKENQALEGGSETMCGAYVVNLVYYLSVVNKYLHLMAQFEPLEDLIDNNPFIVGGISNRGNN